MRVLICGSRTWTDDGMIGAALRQLKTTHPDATIVHGAAQGADYLAARCACTLGFQVEAHPADWDRYGRGAGPVRNKEMLNTGIDQVWAFKDDFDPDLKRGGTEHMVRIARDAGVLVWIRSHDTERKK